MTLRNTPDTYVFDNDDVEATHRHQYLAEILDDFSCEQLSRLGDLTGRRCLEVGAGGGSVARWLAGQVTPRGRVVATDVNIRHLPTDAGYEVLEHDLTTEPVPPGPWDLIHARLVLVHLPRRRKILSQLAATLAPGGALVVEEWDSSSGSPLLTAPDPGDAELFGRYQRTVGQVLATAGTDPTWASQVHSAMAGEGLVPVETTVHARSWPGGSAGALLHTVTIDQLQAELVDAGLTTAELDRVRAVVADPRSAIRGLLTYATTGRRPAG